MAQSDLFGRIRPVILSGGAGTRLWPLSRRSKPKQFIPIVGDDSLFAGTLDRVHTRFGFKPPRIIGNEEHRFLIAEEVMASGQRADAIMLEPFGRNTAAAIALSLVKSDPEDVFIVLPSDHEVRDQAAFHAAIKVAVPAAEAGNIVCFGITPDYPETGYGYIESGSDLAASQGVSEVVSFKEKPDQATAQAYLDTGTYSWNSGMFLFKVSTMRAEMEAHLPGLLSSVEAAAAAGTEDLDFVRISETLFEKVQDISIDYGVMERSAKVAVVPISIGWSDLGSYATLHRMGGPDAEGNTMVGPVAAQDCKNSYLHSNGTLLTAQGLDGAAVVATDDAILVTSLADDQKVKQMVDLLKKKDRVEAVQHSTYYRPWGSYRSIADGAGFQVKEIVVYPGKRLSLQLHHRRAEHWVIVAGEAAVTRGRDTLYLGANQSVYIPVETKHRLENVGETDLRLIEVQSGDYLGEDDIVRFDDDFGREGTTQPY